MISVMLIFGSCISPGYVSYEPSYIEYVRPSRPNDVSIWIDGDWNWNNHSRQYQQQTGYWANPRHGETYHKGQWESSIKGKKWSKGYWESNNHKL